ncbi:MAG: hypothetical protein ABR588_00375 [Sphingomicrobium sp.]|nr:hypothetical protein [Sphingomonadales bacterium]
MMPNERIIAIGLLTGDDLAVLGPHFSRAFPIDERQVFGELLRAIDEAERGGRHCAGEERLAAASA